MIDIATLERNMRDCIAQFPTRARHRGRSFDVKLNCTQDMIQAIEAGTRDNMTINLIAIKSDFDGKPPKSMDDFSILVSGKWTRFQIRDVPDFFDPLSPSYTINLQSPQKGIE